MEIISKWTSYWDLPRREYGLFRGELVLLALYREYEKALIGCARQSGLKYRKASFPKFSDWVILSYG
jgi:hypothetical protein